MCSEELNKTAHAINHEIDLNNEDHDIREKIFEKIDRDDDCFDKGESYNDMMWDFTKWSFKSFNNCNLG